ncbi:hypothetical protein [Oceanobacter mangrovi]|uniref:hypothetical protein n=1 Tax=Oceanobacter mangrovi TaxID=2862510 RepID=UPI001C8E9406|nr:hypothetical protein [Oceanobacter mangrovi]
MSRDRLTPQTRAVERAAMNAATAAFMAAGGQIEQIPASQYRKNHGLNKHPNGRTNINLKRAPRK